MFAIIYILFKMSKTTDLFNLSSSKTTGSFNSSPSKNKKSSPKKTKKSGLKVRPTNKENYGPIINKIVAPNNTPYKKTLSSDIKLQTPPSPRNNAQSPTPQISNVSGWGMPAPLPLNIKIG